MATVKYTGDVATVFDGHGEVEPQGTFEVPDAQVGAYTRRADIERVDVDDTETEHNDEEEPTATDAE